MSAEKWPDPLQPPDPERVRHLCAAFWRQLSALPDLVNRDEQLLAAECISALRALVVEMMLALNGIRRPPATTHLNAYLGDSQRAVMERTLVVDAVDRRSWVGCAVALVVVYRWYAPQLTARFDFAYPLEIEEEVWQQLRRDLPDWPLSVTTE